METPITTQAGPSLHTADAVSGFKGGQKVLNRYRLERILGQGGMGVVWLARDEELERDVALKFLPEIVVNDRASLNELKKETRRSLELTHPHIVRTYDFVQDSSVAGISMEYVDSDTLRNLRIDQPDGVFQTGQLGDWTRHLCSALDYAHTQAGIVHRDLKPANLMINRKSQLKVTDFGISRSIVETVTQMTMQTGVSGTLVYMSPQQLSGDSASPLDDVYAIGATLYELLTTRPPFYAGDIPGQIHNKIPPSVAERRASLGIPPGEIAPEWEETVAACLAKDPAQRPQSAAEIAARLGLQETATFTARPTGSIAPVLAPVAAAAGAKAAFRPGSSGPATSPATAAAPVAASPVSPAWAAHPAVAALLADRRRLALVGGGLLAALVVLFLILHSVSSGRAEAERQRREVAARQLAIEQQNAEYRRQAEERQAADQRRMVAERLANAHGTLTVNTDPPGALVQIGSQQGRSPYSFENLKVGEAQVQISMDGFESKTITAHVEENRALSTDTVTLTPAKGMLAIDTEPGFAYELRSKLHPDQPITGTTPLKATEIPAGEYEVTVMREGFQPLKQNINLHQGQPQTLSFAFPTAAAMQSGLAGGAGATGQPGGGAAGQPGAGPNAAGMAAGGTGALAQGGAGDDGDDSGSGTKKTGSGTRSHSGSTHSGTTHRAPQSSGIGHAIKGFFLGR